MTHTDCLKRCRQLPDAYARATCCADCLALRGAQLERQVAPQRSPRRGRRGRSSSHATPPLAGLGDAASDRAAAQSTAAAITAAATIACQALTDPNERARCVASVAALSTAAGQIINQATTPTPTSNAEAEAALEELRRELEEVQAQAELQRQAELQAQQERLSKASTTEGSGATTLVLGALAIAGVAGVGYLALKDSS